VLLFGLESWLDGAMLESMFPGAELHRMHGIGHGLVAWMIALCALIQVWRPRERYAAAVLGLVVMTAYTVAALVSGIFSGLEIAGIAAFGALVWRHPGRRIGNRKPIRPIALAAAAPLVLGSAVFAVGELQRQVAGLAADPHVAFGHYALMATLATSIVTAVVIGATSWPGASAAAVLGIGIAIAYGLASIVYPGSASSLGEMIGAAVIVLALLAAGGLLAIRGTGRLRLDPGPTGQPAG
jgi:hypothetical protein